MRRKVAKTIRKVARLTLLKEGKSINEIDKYYKLYKKAYKASKGKI